ncbi:MAG: DUF485 domain-containing protein [Hyphomicrobiaceae bacterium]
MSSDELNRIRSNPLYRELIGRRRRFAGILATLMLLIYFGFVLLVAFDKSLLATPIGSGVTTIGIPLGLFVIISAFILTGIYVRRANGEFDELTQRLMEE